MGGPGGGAQRALRGAIRISSWKVLWIAVGSTTQMERLSSTVIRAPGGPVSGLQLVSSVDLSQLSPCSASCFSIDNQQRPALAPGLGVWLLAVESFCPGAQWLQQGQQALAGDVTFQMMCGMVSRRLPDGIPAALEAYGPAIRHQPGRPIPTTTSAIFCSTRTPHAPNVLFVSAWRWMRIQRPPGTTTASA